ncbi:MAG TPA: hypothetical protein VMO47_15890 [Rhodothermales bacterium]|nr:hypothetical protein [Rhodothermales bacterium]
MRVTIFSTALVVALALVAGVLASCKDNPVDPLADEETFDRAVLGLGADARDRSVEVHWGIGILESKQLHRSKETQYRLLFSENGLADMQPVVEGRLGDKFSGSHLFDNLENGRPYYFGVEIVNMASGGILSDAVMAVPHTPNPTEFVLTPQPLEQRYAAWSPDGHSIAYVGYFDSTAADTGQEYLWDVLFVHDLASGQSTRYTDHAESPGWSPDSKRLVFQVSYARKSVIKVLDIASRTVTVITDGGTEDLTPSWSPDGNRIAYLSHSQTSSELRVHDLVKHLSTTIATGSTPWFHPSNLFSTPSWTPSGDRIVCARRRIESEESERDIYTMTIDGGDLQPVVKSPWDDFQPAYSPDGRRVAFLSRRSGATNVWTMDLDTGSLAQVTSEGVAQGSLSWSADGTQIVFIGYRDHLMTPQTVRVPDHR